MRASILAASALMTMLVTATATAEDPSPAPAWPGKWPPPGVVPLPPPPAAVPAASPAPAPPAAPAEKKKPGSRVPGAALLVLGGVGLGFGAVFGAIATATGAQARSQCIGTICPPSAAPDIARTKTFESSSYVALAAGGVIAAAGLVLVIVAPGTPEPIEASNSVRLAPWIGPRSGGAGFAITF